MKTVISPLPIKLGKFRRLPPHIAVFIILSFLYFIPLWGVSVGAYDKGGVLSIGLDAQLVIGKIFLIYAAGCTAFICGSAFTSWLVDIRRSCKLSVVTPTWIRIQSVDVGMFAILLLAFTITKILLIPEGVYANYAFDTGGMASSVWTASMFLSDALVFAAILALFSQFRRKFLLFGAISLLNGINLLHGTRNFLVITLLCVAVYAYSQTKLSLLKLAAYGSMVFATAMALGYAIFIMRSHVEGAGFALLDVLSPLIYESVFSQISLVSLLNHPIIFSTFGSPLHLFQDVAFFSIPRLLMPEKGSELWINNYGWLSPLGAFNGYASGLLYFGVFFPVFYFFWGSIAGLLYRWSSNQYGAMVYFYYSCDFLFRIFRDGYVIPLKILLNTCELMFLLASARIAVRIFKTRRGSMPTLLEPFSSARGQ